MSKIKKMISIMLVFSCIVMGFGCKVQAASYPLFYPEQYSMSCYVGDTVYLNYSIYPEYENESISIKIYDSNGRCVASGDEDFYNYDIFTRNYTISWNTKGEKRGKYKVVADMKFYTYFDWRSCPSSKVSYITVKNKPQNGVSVKKVKNVFGYKIKASWKKVKNAKKYQVRIGSRIYKTKKTSFVSNELRQEKWYNVKVRAYVGKKWGPWSPKRSVYTMD